MQISSFVVINLRTLKKKLLILAPVPNIEVGHSDLEI